MDVYGYKGTQVYHDTVVLTDEHATPENSNWKGLDQVGFVPTTMGEVQDDSQGGSGTYVVFDDLSGKVFSGAANTHIVDHGRVGPTSIVTGTYTADAGHLPVIHGDMQHMVHPIA